MGSEMCIRDRSLERARQYLNTVSPQSPSMVQTPEAVQSQFAVLEEETVQLEDPLLVIEQTAQTEPSPRESSPDLTESVEDFPEELPHGPYPDSPPAEDLPLPSSLFRSNVAAPSQFDGQVPVVNQPQQQQNNPDSVSLEEELVDDASIGDDEQEEQPSAVQRVRETVVQRTQQLASALRQTLRTPSPARSRSTTHSSSNPVPAPTTVQSTLKRDPRIAYATYDTAFDLDGAVNNARSPQRLKKVSFIRPSPASDAEQELLQSDTNNDDASSVSFSDSESSHSDSSQSDRSRRRRRSNKHKKSRKHKKKERNSSKILTELMKNGMHYQIKQLQNHPDVDRRVKEFIVFSESLRRITMLTPELENVFERLDRIQPPKNNSKRASQALYHFILSKIDPSLSAILEAFTEERKVADGPSAYLKLRSVCAPQDSSSRHQATTNFFALRIHDSETLQKFNTRFNNHYKLVQASGSIIDPSEVIDQYLRAIQPITNPILQVRIQMFRQQRAVEIQTSEAILSPLTIIQSELQREEEQTIALAAFQAVQTQPRRSTAKAANNQTSRGPKPISRPRNKPSPSKAPAGVICYGCGRTGHYLRHCPTTSASDREQVMNEIRRNNPSSGRTPNRSNANKTPPSTIPATTVSVSEATIPTSNTTSRSRSVNTAIATPSAVRFINAAQRVPDERQIVIYEDEVIINSGVSDHMASSPHYLSDTFPLFSEVILADGTIAYSETAGTMRVKCTDVKSGRQHIVPLFNAIYVKGFTKCLWSVPAFAQSGHEIVFGTSTIRIVMNKDTSEELTIYLNHPYYRQRSGARIFANMVHVSPNPPASRKRKRIDLELVHRRLGHPSTKTLLAAEEADCYGDVTIGFAPTGPCIDCQIGAIRTANRGSAPVGAAQEPGSVWFLDVIDNPSKIGLTKASYFPHYLTMLDSASRYQVFVGMSDVTSRTVILCVQLIGTVHRPHANFTMDDVAEFHVDAGSQLISKEFKDWAAFRQHPIKVEAAAPNHQEQNGKVEAGWRHCRQITFKILTTASLGHEFFDVALQYAWQIKAVLPLRSLFVTLPDGTTRPSTPYETYFKQITRIGRYHVFGCPIVVKVYRRRQIDGNADAQTLTSKNLIQRGVRGLFIGFPIDQAGYLCWLPSVGRFLVSEDVAFDEYFQSPLAFPNRIYHDATPTRDASSGRRDTTLPLSHTGPPYVLLDDADPLLPWAPYTAIPPSLPVDNVQFSDTYFDVFPTEEKNVLDVDVDASEPLSAAASMPPPETESTESTVYDPTMGLPEFFINPNAFTFSEDERKPAARPTQEEIDEVIRDTINTVMLDDAVEETVEIETDCQSTLFDSDEEQSVLSDEADFDKENEPPSDFDYEQAARDILANDFDDQREVRQILHSPHDNEMIEEMQQDRPYEPDFHLRRSSRVRQSTQDDEFQYSNNAQVQHQVSYALRAYARTIADPYAVIPLAEDYADAITIPLPGEPGSDPSFFIPEPRSLAQVAKMPLRYRKPWTEAFVKEFKGLVRMNAFKIGNPGPDDSITPVMDIYRCKLDGEGMIEKLKARIVFRGDLHESLVLEDSWNPFASYQSLRFFLALCAKYNITPSQADWVQAYLQCPMKEKVFIKFPDFWAKFLPDELAKYCGTVLEVLKALYGHKYSGKRLYEEQEDFLLEQNFQKAPLPGIWYKLLPNDCIILALVFADDQMTGSNDAKALHEYRTALEARFEVNWKPIADWFLQARIQRDKDGNITLDQSRYSKAIVQRYLPNSAQEATAAELKKFRNPLPRAFKWTKDDSAETSEEAYQLESEYGYRFIEVVGSLIYLSNTAIHQLFAIRKMCKHMHKAGRKHYRAINHLLHHLRCYPTKPLIYYHDVFNSPLAGLLRSAGYPDVDPTFVYFTDSAFGDCDGARSTGCFLGFFQGGLIDFSSSVPLPVALSAAEAETNYASVTCMATMQSRRAYMAIVYGDEDRHFSVPIFTDSKATIDISLNDRGTPRTRHMTRRALYVRYCKQTGTIVLYHVDGDKYQIADIGTKGDIVQADFDYKCSIMEAPSPCEATKVWLQSHLSRRGVLEQDDGQTAARVTEVDESGSDVITDPT